MAYDVYDASYNSYVYTLDLAATDAEALRVEFINAVCAHPRAATRIRPIQNGYGIDILQAGCWESLFYLYSRI